MTNASQTSEGEMLNFRKESLTGLDNRNWLINATDAGSSPRCLGTRADRPTHAIVTLARRREVARFGPVRSFRDRRFIQLEPLGPL